MRYVTLCHMARFFFVHLLAFCHECFLNSLPKISENNV
jgi:hypothetical protein